MGIVKYREAFEKMCELADSVGEKTGLTERLVDSFEEDDDNPTMSKGLKIEMLFYLCYLSAADGLISRTDAKYISDILGTNISPSKIEYIVNERNLFDGDFSTTVPKMLEIFTTIDNVLYQNDVDMEQRLSDAIVNLYKFMSLGMFESNGKNSVDELDEDEREAFQSYLSMMQEYLRENSSEMNEDVVFDRKKGKKSGKTDEKEITHIKKDNDIKVKAGAVKAPSKKA